MRALLIALAGACALSAHDITPSVAVQAFLKPEPGRVLLAVRVPLRAVRDVEFPERPGGYLDLDKLSPRLPDAVTLWIGNLTEVWQDGAMLPKPRVASARISLAADRSFASFDQAMAALRGPRLDNSVAAVWSQVWLDALLEYPALEYPARAGSARFAIRPMFAHFGERVVTGLRFIPPEGPERAFEFTGNPGLVELDPGWFDAARRFVASGFFHILDGVDHLLFLACLVMPSRRPRELVWLVTAFTAAHSVTLIAAARGVAPDAGWFPPFVETLIAASIVWMALENIVGATAVRRRWIAAFGFGLVHGFGFSFALRETLQFAGSHVAASLVAFNVGVELGQLAALAVMVPALEFLFRWVVAERMGTVILSALIAHTAWHWMTERWADLRRHEITAPDAATTAGLLRLAALIVVAVGVVWAIRQRRARGA